MGTNLSNTLARPAVTIDILATISCTHPRECSLCMAYNKFDICATCYNHKKWTCIFCYDYKNMTANKERR